MHRHIKAYVFGMFICITSVMMVGCFLHSAAGPGYSVYISVSDEAELNAEDISFLDAMAKNTGLGALRIKSSSKWVCASNDVIQNQPQGNKEPISFGYCYAVVEPGSRHKSTIKAFYISIGNNWHGQSESLKADIDRLANIIVAEMVKRFGPHTVTLERRRTGPPF